MPFIVSNWERYFIDNNEGLGTTYERFILHRYFQKIQAEHTIDSVLEVPSFGMTGVSGINSMWWAAQTIPVTVVDNDIARIAAIAKIWRQSGLKVNLVCQDNFSRLAFADNTFDLAWNFAALWFIPNLTDFFIELARVAKKAIFICVPNISNLFHHLHFDVPKGSESDLFLSNIEPTSIQSAMAEIGWTIDKEGFFDIPPWPDIAMKKEDLLKRLGLHGMAKKWQKKRPGRMCILDYYANRDRELQQKVLKYDFLENMPLLFQRFWAHQRYFVFVPKIF